MRVLFIHGACVQDGRWWWHRTAASLDDRRIPSQAAVLPSCGETGQDPGTDGPGYDADVVSVRGALLATPEPTVVVAHSYGGIVAAEAIDGLTESAGGPVRHLILVSSYLPEVGEGLFSFGGPEPAPFLDVDTAGGTFTVRAAALQQTFLQDCPDLAADAEERLAKQSLSVIGQPVGAAGWKQVPTTYLVCVEDAGTPVAAQREFARRADRSHELSAGHHPFLSKPGAVAHLIDEITR